MVLEGEDTPGIRLSPAEELGLAAAYLRSVYTGDPTIDYSIGEAANAIEQLAAEAKKLQHHGPGGGSPGRRFDS